MCTIQLWLCELTMVVCTKLFKMKHVRPKGRVYWTPKHVKQPHLRINRHMMFWEHNNAEQHFNNCQSALWCKHVQIGEKQNCTMHHSTKYGICFFTHVGKAGPTLYLYHGQITFGPTYSSLFGVSGSMPSVSNKPGVLAPMMAWLTCAGVAFGFWAR